MKKEIDANQKPQTSEAPMSDKEKPELGEIFAGIALAATLAVFTLPILHLTGIHEILMNLSAEMTNTLFRALGVPI